MKKLIFILFGSLFIACGAFNIPFVTQDLSLTGNIRPVMTPDEVIEIMGEPIISELRSTIEEWHYCKTGALIKLQKDTFVALYFFENKLIAKEYYVANEGYGSCENFIKTGDYKVPPQVQKIWDENN